MNVYTQKKRWKLSLFATAAFIVAGSLWYSNILVRKIAAEQRQNIRIWADAIQSRAALVKHTEDFFETLKDEERKRVELLAEATKRLIYAEDDEELTFYSEIISGNTTIPVIQTDIYGNIKGVNNIDLDTAVVKVLEGELRQEFTVYEPVKVSAYGNISYIYYKNSHTYTQLRNYLEHLIESFFSEVVLNAASVPVIITDSTKNNVIEYGNIDSARIQNPVFVQNTIVEMAGQNDPIIIDLAEQGTRYIFYKDSYLLTQLRYYPIIQFSIIGLFLFITYLLFNTARKSEQNQVWVGMSKETAHQLGTPLSSIMAWIELLKLKQLDNKIVQEIENDVNRLQIISERFSKIGSIPKLVPENIIAILYDSTEYLKTRTSKKITYRINHPKDHNITAPINLHLFEWVIENLCKNAIDAMGSMGVIDINITEDLKKVFVDISDTGKGVSRSNQKTIFNPGVTSKRRGWGLGLSLSKRIIKDYHKGKIFVKSSVIDKGTTFRIVLNK
ncbi:MAG: HAMP domain-containing histidine kinase [Bacteroidales bacterium]|nr:HAMP domain-containing histidine kinase [Bacteroidales bacterium]